MELRDALLVLHVGLFGIWLGSDFATFLSSRFVMKEDLAVSTRTTIAKLMLLFDLGPRIALVLMLPAGLALAQTYGGPFQGVGPTIAIWAVALAWLWAVLTIHFKEGSALAERLRSIDLGFRSLVAAGLVGSAVWSLAGDSGPFFQTFLAVKVLLFGLIIACGIAIRFALKPFSATFGALVTHGSTPEREAQLKRDLIATYPYVFAIWTMVIVAAILGVVRP